MRRPSATCWPTSRARRRLCSSEDADADGVEGGHATFTPAQVREALSGRPDLVEAALTWYGVTEAGNWEGSAVLTRPLGAPLARPAEVEAAAGCCSRPGGGAHAPARDDKVICEWNAMTAAVLAEAAGGLAEPGWGERAAEVGELLFGAFRRADGRWVRTLARAGPPGLRRRLRLAGRVRHPPGRVHRAGRVAGTGRRGGRRLVRAVRRPGRRRGLHHRARRPAPRGALQRAARRGHPLGQLGGRLALARLGSRPAATAIAAPPSGSSPWPVRS